MKIEITDRQAVVLGIAITSYNKELEEYKKRSGEQPGGYNEAAQQLTETKTILGIIDKGLAREKGRISPNFKKELHDLATEAFWYIKKQVDEQGHISAIAKYAGNVLAWNDCHEYPFVGIGTRGEVVMYNDNWHGHNATDSEILEIAIKLQEGQGNV